MPKYLNNKDLLREIHQSKNSYCWFRSAKLYSDYDEIIYSMDGITEEGKVYRMITDAHIPRIDGKVPWMNFTPFMHYIKQNGQIRCVGKSHQREGQITNELGKMYIKMVENYKKRAQWRGYDEAMSADAVCKLIVSGLKFDEDRSQNPFAFLTSVITNEFRTFVNAYHRQENIKEDMRQDVGDFRPSYHRQAIWEIEERINT